jgi:hypothetical protein
MNDEFEEEVDYRNHFQVLTDVRLDIIHYIERLMQDEPYYFKLYLPAKNAEVAKISPETTLELLHCPFGIFSLNLWNKILADKENPVHELLVYFDFEVRSLRMLLSIKDYDEGKCITTEELIKHNVLDVYGLHGYEHIYTDAQRFFEGWRVEPVC